MKIGVPKEVKNNEYRVGLTPASVAASKEIQKGRGDISLYSSTLHKGTKYLGTTRRLSKVCL